MDESAAIAPVASVEATQAGDLAASFEAFVDAESARFHGALRLLTRDRADAEDLMQEALLRVWERWEHVRTLENPVGYLYRTAMNLHRKRLRRAAVAIRHAVRPGTARDPLDEVESRDEVLRALARLTPRQRMSLVLMDLLDHSSEEAARLMGVSATTVRGLAPHHRSAPRMVLEGLWVGQDGRMRLYLPDLPEGMSARILAIAISALDSEFERVVEAATPVVDSFQFHAP